MTLITVGTSGWSYPAWKRSLYRDVPQQRWLERYSEVYDTVEVNITYRRDLTRDTAATWIAATPDHFRFVIKAHQRATHFNRLKTPVEDAAIQAAQARFVGQQLGLVYFQMPHNFARNDDLLARFLAEWPDDLPAVWEFAHLSWHNDAVHDLLREHRTGWVVSDAKTDDPSFVTTSGNGYVRLRRESYDGVVLRQRATGIRSLSSDRTWVFVRHGADAPRLATKVSETIASPSEPEP